MVKHTRRTSPALLAVFGLGLGAAALAQSAASRQPVIPGTIAERLAIDKLDDDYRRLQETFDKLATEAKVTHAAELHGYAGALLWDRRAQGWAMVDTSSATAPPSSERRP